MMVNVTGAERHGLPGESHYEQSEISMIASFDGGSLNYPYRSLLKDTSFPRCHLMARPGLSQETYTGSLIMLGHGTPLWNPHGFLHNGPQNTGISIGDVGYLHHDGLFERFFNIFLPAKHPAQLICPPDLVPLDPPLDSEITVNPTHFPPGTVLVGNGIETSTLSSTPLDVKFTVNGREGGMLVLPDGASREDLSSTTRIQDYVQKHALSWYIFVNKGPGTVVHPNGTLYLVTGADKASVWANCVTYASQTRLNRLWKPSEIIYYGPREDSGQYWESSREITAAFECQESREIGEEDEDERVTKYALFIRGMRFAVNVRDWTEHVLNYAPPEDTLFNLIRTVPNFGLQAKIQTLKECRPGYTEMIPREGGNGIRVIFHPLDVLLRLLLEEFPLSTMAYVEDHIWSSVADKSDANLSSIIRLLVQILETHQTSTKEGTITLVPRPAVPQDQTVNSMFGILSHLMQKYNAWRQRRKIVTRLAKVFPGPGVPSDSLRPQRL